MIIEWILWIIKTLMAILGYALVSCQLLVAPEIPWLMGHHSNLCLCHCIAVFPLCLCRVPLPKLLLMMTSFMFINSTLMTSFIRSYWLLSGISVYLCGVIIQQLSDCLIIILGHVIKLVELSWDYDYNGTTWCKTTEGIRPGSPYAVGNYS